MKIDPKTIVDYMRISDGEEKVVEKTGAQRGDSGGKGRYDLLPPIFLHRLARHYENGAKKYGERNWERGLSMKRYIDSAERHINFFKMGDTSEDHLAAAAWNLACFIETQELVRQGKLPKDLDDFGKPTDPEPKGVGQDVAPAGVGLVVGGGGLADAWMTKSEITDVIIGAAQKLSGTAVPEESLKNDVLHYANPSNAPRICGAKDGGHTNLLAMVNCAECRKHLGSDDETRPN